MYMYVCDVYVSASESADERLDHPPGPGSVYVFEVAVPMSGSVSQRIMMRGCLLFLCRLRGDPPSPFAIKHTCTCGDVSVTQLEDSFDMQDCSLTCCDTDQNISQLCL